MKDVRRFATEDRPLHPSGLRSLLECSWRVAMSFLADEADDAGSAAGNTGSAFHVAAAEFHRGKRAAECLEAMANRIREYPQADLEDAAGMFLKYSVDPRNSGAKVVAVERPISFTISPAPEDPTGYPIHIIGTLDQVREVDGRLFLWDTKTAKKEGVELLHKHLFQVAAYCVGATYELGGNVEPGGLILPRKYKDRDPSTASAFFHFPWKLRDTGDILRGIRHQVALVRRGDMYHVPGSQCDWCPQRTPDYCFPKLQQLRLRMQTSS